MWIHHASRKRHPVPAQPPYVCARVSTADLPRSSPAQIYQRPAKPGRDFGAEKNPEHPEVWDDFRIFSFAKLGIWMNLDEFGWIWNFITGYSFMQTTWTEIDNDDLQTSMFFFLLLPRYNKCPYLSPFCGWLEIKRKETWKQKAKRVMPKQRAEMGNKKWGYHTQEECCKSIILLGKMAKPRIQLQ